MTRTMPNARNARARTLKFVRRLHLYTGLLLLPWVIFFGLSGMLFNHPNVGEDVHGRRLAPERLRELTGFEPWPPAVVAGAVVDGLNASTGRKYTLDPSFAERFSGVMVLQAPSADGRHNLLLDLEQGFAILATRKARPEGERPAFAGTQLELPAYSVEAVEQRFAGLLEAEGLDAKAPLKGSPRASPRLEFRVIEEDGVVWNTTYHLGNGSLEGRRSDRWPSIGPSQLLARLHTTHHFTTTVTAKWFWALFEDLLGLAMVIWGVSGIVMWWQLKRTRTVGLVALAVALGLAAVVMVGTAGEVLFGHVPQTLGPG